MSQREIMDAPPVALAPFVAFAKLAALESALRRQGWRAAPGAGVEAAVAHYAACAPAPDIEPEDSLGADGIGRI